MKFITQGLTRQLHRQALVGQKHAPRIMFAAGIAGTVVSTVLACRATLKLGDTLDDFQQAIDEAGDSNKKRAITYALGTVEVAKLYAPAALVGVASIGLLTGSHITLSRRNASLTAAYAGMHKAYEDYRQRVRDELGEEKELDLYQNARYEEIEVDGKKEKLRITDPGSVSPYARLFDEYNPNWTKDPEMNRGFVIIQQNVLNDLLWARGHIFLNEVYDALGLKRSPEGQIVGWVVNRDGHQGDGYIDFGLFTKKNTPFLEGWERSVWLDFNVDGEIWNLIG